MNRIPSLDGFRAISIILVIIAHSEYAKGFLFHEHDIFFYIQGIFGVTVFFVISGFLITYLLLKEDERNKFISHRSFYIRRILRIFPVYFLYCFFVFVAKYWEGYPILNDNYLHILTFSANFDHHLPAFTQHFWSLSVEEQFYLIWPGLLIVFRKNLKRCIIIFLILSIISRVISYKFPEHSIYTLIDFFHYADSIFIGALGGILFFENKFPNDNKILNSIVLHVFLIMIIFVLIYFSAAGKFGKLALPFGNTIISFSILIIIFSYITPSNKLVYKLLNSNIMVHIGVLSYSLYVWQQFFLCGQVGIYRTLPYNIIIIYFVSLGSYYLWEKPFLKLKSRFA